MRGNGSGALSLFVAFAVGCVVGARTAGENFNDVLQSARAVRDSDEFKGLVAAVRTHAGQTLRHLADVVETGSEGEATQDLVDRVKHLIASSGLRDVADPDGP